MVREDTNANLLKKAQQEIEEGLESCHCDKCGCMIEALNNIQSFLDSRKPDDLLSDFRDRMKSYQKELKPKEST